MFSEDHAVRITVQHGGHGNTGIWRPAVVLGRFGPQCQQPIDVSGRSGAQRKSHRGDPPTCCEASPDRYKVAPRLGHAPMAA
jgi:hypothetical protein